MVHMTTTTTATTKATDSAVVGFDRVTKAYGDVRAVDGLTLALHPGETVALLGPNGAGKSTTLDLLLGLKNADSGTVGVFGTSPREAIVAGRVGAMLQSGGLMDDVTVAELVRLACDLHPRPYPVSDVLARSGITQIADRRVHKLSGGQAQRVRFALATAGDSDLIVLDEPTTGMLTDREREVLRAAAGGSTNAELAKTLHLSQGTVRNYLSTAIHKLAVRNRTEAVRTAREKGWL